MLTDRQAAELYACMDRSLERAVLAKCSAGIVPGVAEADELARAAIHRGYLEWWTNARIAAGPKGVVDVGSNHLEGTEGEVPGDLCEGESEGDEPAEILFNAFEQWRGGAGHPLA